VAIPHKIRETATICQFHSKAVCTGCVCMPELIERIGTAIETITADMRNNSIMVQQSATKGTQDTNAVHLQEHTV